MWSYRSDGIPLFIEFIEEIWQIDADAVSLYLLE